MDLFWQGKHDQRLHVYVVERIAKSPNDGAKLLFRHYCAPSFLRSVCEIGGVCFGPGYFSEGAQLPKKNTEVKKKKKKTPTHSHNDRNKDGAKLLLS